MLNASARNSKATSSLMAKCLNSAMSIFQWPGLRRKFRPESPSVRPRGATKAFGFAINGPNPEAGSSIQNATVTKHAAIRCVVDRVAVGIRDVELQGSDTAPQLRLQRVVAGTSFV